MRISLQFLDKNAVVDALSQHALQTHLDYEPEIYLNTAADSFDSRDFDCAYGIGAALKIIINMRQKLANEHPELSLVLNELNEKETKILQREKLLRTGSVPGWVRFQSSPAPRKQSEAEIEVSNTNESYRKFSAE